MRRCSGVATVCDVGVFITAFNITSFSLLLRPKGLEPAKRTQNQRSGKVLAVKQHSFRIRETL